MKQFRKIIIIAALAIIIIDLFFFDYNNLSWANNRSNYLGLISGILIIISMIFSNKFGKDE